MDCPPPCTLAQGSHASYRADLRAELAPNMLLAILWASQANTVPATFWSLAMLLLPENKDYRSKVLSELKLEYEKERGDDSQPSSKIKAGKDGSHSLIPSSDPLTRAAFKACGGRVIWGTCHVH